MGNRAGRGSSLPVLGSGHHPSQVGGVSEAGGSGRRRESYQSWRCPPFPDKDRIDGVDAIRPFAAPFGASSTIPHQILVVPSDIRWRFLKRGI